VLAFAPVMPTGLGVPLRWLDVLGML